jgi:hypothetical protein
VTTATGSCVWSRRTPGWGTQISVAEAPHPGPGRLEAALAQPQLNHAEQHAAMQFSARVEALTLRPGQTRNPLGPPGSRGDISYRSLSRRARSLCTMFDLQVWWWQVLGSNQRRLSRRFYRPLPLAARATCHMPSRRTGFVKDSGHGGRRWYASHAQTATITATRGPQHPTQTPVAPRATCHPAAS